MGDTNEQEVKVTSDNPSTAPQATATKDAAVKPATEKGADKAKNVCEFC